MHETLVKNFNHCGWANGKLLECFASYDLSEPKCLGWLAHILSAERIWLKRLRGLDSSTEQVWPEYGLEACRELQESNLAAWNKYLKGLSGQSLEQSISYRNQSGRQFSQTALEILQHVLLHGHYHRGQINSRLRENGIEPPVLDYIIWLRIEDGQL